MCYFAAPRKLKNAVLFVFSLIFYGWGEPRYIVLMIVSIVSGFVFALMIEKKQNKKSGLILMWISVAVSLSFLLIFKYADFLIENVNQLPGVSLPLSKLSLPIGISFYTFQIISYTVDVWRGDTKAQRNIISFGTYVSLFPQLIAGPIVRYTDIERELQERKHSVTLAASGIKRFLIGLSKKVLIANVLGELTDICLKTSQPSILSWWMYAAALVLQIYFDFSGYSDMAIGLGRIFGFQFPENFNYPLISRSVKEFWRRWHISLSSWFRDYVYIPLGGSRVKTGLYVRNVIAVWMLTGLWHGASWNFVLWGAGFGVLLLCERFLWGKWLERMPSIISHLYLLFIILLSFILFSADTIPQAMQRIGGLFGAGKLPVISVQSVYYLRSYGLLLIFAAIAVLGWALEGVMIGFAMKHIKDEEDVQASPQQLLCLRYFVAMVTYAVVVLPVIKGYPMAFEIVSQGLVFKYVGIAILGAFTYLCWYKAVDMIGSAMGTALNSTAALWTIIFSAVLFRSKITGTLAFWGIVIVTGVFIFAIDPKKLKGTK